MVSAKLNVRGVLRNWNLWVVLALLVACLVLHYPQQILGLSSPSVFSFMGLDRHAVERILLLVPICYAASVFGLGGGLITLAAASAIMIPRVFLISEHFSDALLETVGIIGVGVMTDFWINGYKKQKEQRQWTLAELDGTYKQLEARTADLEVSERKYRELFEYANDAIWEQALDGRIANANQAFELLTGYSRQELLGMNVKSFMGEESLTLASSIKKSLFSAAPIEQPYEQRVIRRDGTMAVIEMATSLIKENGKPTGYLHIARDVTGREQLKAVLSMMEEGIAVIGQDRKIQFMNPSLMRQFGESKDEYCYKVFHRLNRPCEVCRLSSAVSGTTSKREWTSEDGNTYDIVYTPFTGPDQKSCILAAFMDVTRRKRIETELVRLNNVQSELLTQQTERLKQITGEVAKLEEEKTRFIRFLGVVAHDLKSPLSVSQSILSGIVGEYYGPVNEEQKDMIGRITRRIEGLNALIDDLIDIPLIETGQLVQEMKEFSLRDLLEASVAEFRVLASEKGLLLVLQQPPDLPVVYGSSRRLQQVVNNLISNAIKYSERGVVLVRCREEGNQVKVAVSDEGIGIPGDDLKKLFSDFFRGKNARASKGTGLGLSISRRIVEAHGGKIWAESPNPDTNSGSRLTFAIPRSIGPLDAAGKSSQG